MRGSVVVISIVIALIAGGAARAASRSEPAQTDQTLIGTWGGDRIRMDAAATGARIQVDCLFANTDEAIPLDKNGTFAITVTFVPTRGAQLDGPENPPASKVTGRVEDDVLHITIVAADSEANGTFKLQRNSKGKLPNCRFRS